MTKIAVLVERNNILKLFLPIIQLLLSEKSDLVPVMITSRTLNQGNKGSQNYDPAFNPFHNQIEIAYIDELKEIPQQIQKFGARILLTEGFLSDELLLEIKKRGCKVVCLQHSIDMAAVWPYTRSLRFYQLVDAFMCFSPYWMGQLIEKLRQHRRQDVQFCKDIEKKTFFVGMPELDQIRDFNKQKILTKYHIPDGKKILFFDPVGQVNHVPNFFYKYYFSAFGSRRKRLKFIIKNLLYDFRYSKQIFCKIGKFLLRFVSCPKIPRYDKVFQHVKDLCREKGCHLVSKSRQKNNDPDFVRKGCDLFLYDQGYLPFTLLELLFVSDVYVGFNSSAILEAVYCGLPVATCQVFPTKFQYGPYGGAVYQYLEHCFYNQGEWLNFPGVTTNCGWDDKGDDFFKKIPELYLNKNSRKAYVEKFLGFDDGKSSARLVRAVQERLL